MSLPDHFLYFSKPQCCRRRPAMPHAAAMLRCEKHQEEDMGHPASAAPGAQEIGVPGPHRPALPALSLAALGVVYGDIGTSPLYTLSTVFDAETGLPLNAFNIVGIVSLIFWSLMILVSLKY